MSLQWKLIVELCSFWMNYRICIAEDAAENTSIWLITIAPEKLKMWIQNCMSVALCWGYPKFENSK